MGPLGGILQVAAYPLALIFGYLLSDRRSKGSQAIEARQAAAAEGASVAGLAAQVTGLAKDVGRLEKQVRELSAENETMRRRLETTQDRLTAAMAFVQKLVSWMEAGAQAPAPAVPTVLASDILLPAAWLHPNSEAPKE